MQIILIFVYLNIFFYSLFSFSLNETIFKIKYVLSNYKSLVRNRRHTTNYLTVSKYKNFTRNALNFFEETERINDFLRSFDISECSVLSNRSYVKRHVFDGLLLHHNVPETHWYEYKSVYNKQYPNLYHEKMARAKWMDNLRRVVSHNQEYLAGLHSYSLHLNHLGDMHSTDYFKNILKLIDTVPLFDPAEDHRKTSFVKYRRRAVPRTVDWRSHGYRPRREQQFECGACYAFAVAHAVQAQQFRKYGDNRELSPQQIVDCSYPDGNEGCDGGSLRAALRYVARNGLILEEMYPYKGKRGYCRYTSLLVRSRPKRWAILPEGDEMAVQKALATIGPLAVAVNAAPVTFQLYRSGIYDDPFCTPWYMNHAMLLVGYTPQYWVLLNWWGKHWGEDGYISISDLVCYRIRRGFNRCGVANMAVYVEV